MTDGEQDLIAWLEQWFSRHCDGEWEHSWGLTIETLDNPGWLISIDVEGTDGFRSVKWERAGDHWLDARLDGGKLRIACGPHDLREALELARRSLEEGNA